jgi:mersacidin/lichenicidin family type 2 lantibiotic
MDIRQMTVRAWRDPVFRSTLPAETLLELPRHPAGDTAEAEELRSLAGQITLGDGCGTYGCSKAICTDPCTRTCWAQCPNTSDGGGCQP